MQLHVENRPRSRGVSQLMYVGDDEAVETACSYNRAAMAMCLGGLAFAALGPAKHSKPAALVALLGFLAL